MAEVVTAAFVVGELSRLENAMPRVAKLIRRDIFLRTVAVGKLAINGIIMRQSGPNADLARYWGAALNATKQDDGLALTAGLPEADEMARTLAHREVGGRIDPIHDRPNPHLRVPLGPALTGAGYDRYAGVRLRDLIGKGNPFQVIPTPHAPKADAILVKRDAVPLKRDRTVRRGFGVNETSHTTKAGQRPAWYALVPFVVQHKREWLAYTERAVGAEIPDIIAKRLPDLGRKGGEE